MYILFGKKMHCVCRKGMGGWDRVGYGIEVNKQRTDKGGF